jgi:hypothetical protein
MAFGSMLEHAAVPAGAAGAGACARAGTESGCAGCGAHKLWR